MPPKNRKKKFSVKIELSPKGLLGTAVVCLCIFLWMFLLGVWSGQTVLNQVPGSGGKTKKAVVAKRTVQPEIPDQPVKPAVTIEQETVKPASPQTTSVRKEPEPEEDPSYFSVQVGAFKDKDLAAAAVNKWRGKGYEAFSRPPGSGSDPFTRVYVGRFDMMDKAKGQAEQLKKKENLKPFIALIPGTG